MEHELRTDLEDIERMRNYSAVNHFAGPHLRVSSTMAMAPTRTVKDFEDRIARLRSIPSFVDGVIEAAEDARGKGMIPPRVVVDRLLGQLDMQRKPAADQSPLLAPFGTCPRVSRLRIRTVCMKAAAEAYTKSFQPAWQKYRNYVADSYLPKARASLAISELPTGNHSMRFWCASEPPRI